MAFNLFDFSNLNPIKSPELPNFAQKTQTKFNTGLSKQAPGKKESFMGYEINTLPSGQATFVSKQDGRIRTFKSAQEAKNLIQGEATRRATPAPAQIQKPVIQSPYLPTQKQPTQAKAGGISDWLVPKAQAEGDLIQSYLDDKSVSMENRQTVFEMLKDNVPKDKIEGAISSVYKTKQPEQSFLGGALEKTKESFMGGIKRIGEAGVGLAEGKYDVPEALFRGGAGALQTAFSPVSGIVGETIETGIENIPQDFKDYISTKASPTIKDVQTWYNAQPPIQKRRLENIGVGVELLSNFIGAGAIQKTTPTLIKGGEAIGEGTFKGIKQFAKVPGKIGEGIGATTEYGTKLATGLERTTQKLIKEKPSLYKTVKSGKLTAEKLTGDVKTNIEKRLADLSETGKVYQEIKKSPVKFTKTEITKNYDTVFKKEGLSKSLIELPIEDRKAIKQAQYYLKEIPTKELTSKQAVELKAKLRSLVSYDKGVSPEGQRVVKGIIKELDNNLKTKIPGYKQLDEIYGPERQFLNKVKTDILNKDGTLKDNAISTIRNLTGKGKELKIERLENIMPGITEKVNAIKAYEDVQNAISGKVGGLARGVALGGGGYAAGGPIGALATFAITHPSVAENILLTYGIAKEKTKSLLNKLFTKKVLTTEENNLVKSAFKTPTQQVEKSLIQSPLNKSETTKTSLKDLTTNTKGFINPKAIGQDLGLIKKPAERKRNQKNNY